MSSRKRPQSRTLGFGAGTVMKMVPLSKTSSESTFKSEEKPFCRGFLPYCMEIFQRPMCLLSVKGETILEIETKTAEQIAKINCPMVVVAIAGLYRTGKSYLMNCLAGSTQGFALGDTIESKTKGIWAWCKVHPKKENTVLLLLDTEGLGDVEKGNPNYDNKILTLAVLLCNCFLYNMKGVLDQDAVSKLTFVTEMTKNVCYRGKSLDKNHSVNMVLPDFVLCLRDFSLKLWRGEKRISEDEYLEQSLATKEGKDDKFNKPRECIKKYFRVRRCFTLPVPCDGDNLENLDKLPFSKLSTKFKDATDRLLGHVYSLEPMKLLTSKPINGQMFTTLVDRYVTAIRLGAIPDVDDAFAAAAKIENSRISKVAIEKFQKQLEIVVLPVPSKVLDITVIQAQREAIGYLLANVIHDTDRKWKKQAQMEMDNMWNKLKDENTRMIQKECQRILQRTYKASLEEKITKGTYKVVGGYRRFQGDVDKIKTDFSRRLSGYEDCEFMWAWHYFLTQLKGIEGEIIDADNALAEKAKEDERKQNDEKLKRFEEKAKVRSAKALEEQRKQMERHFNTQEEIFKQNLKKEQYRYERYKALVRSELENYKAAEEIKLRLEKKYEVLSAEQEEDAKRIEELLRNNRKLEADNQIFKRSLDSSEGSCTLS